MNSPENRFSAEAVGNVGPAERWISILTGAGLLLSAARGGPLGRLARAGAGLSLVARGASGYCPMKAAMQDRTPMREGFREQLRRLATTVSDMQGQLEQGTSGSKMRGMGRSLASRLTERAAAARMDSMEALYRSELLELHSAEKQLRDLANELARVVRNAPLQNRIRQYAIEIDSREEYMDGLLSRIGGRERKHPDDAMQALIRETHKMMRIAAPSVRDAALTASLQRIIHYKIAGYGTIASYAKAIGRHEEAAQFHQFAEQDKRSDQELSELAKRTLNPEAARERREQQQQQQYQPQTRPH